MVGREDDERVGTGACRGVANHPVQHQRPVQSEAGIVRVEVPFDHQEVPSGVLRERVHGRGHNG